MQSKSPTRADLLFKEITSHQDPAAYLTAMVNSTPPTFENEYLEFKGAEHTPPDHQSVKKNWSKSLSAFANTEGGVLVWGIDSRENSDTKVSAATKLALVADTGALITKLQTLLASVTDPPVQGVTFKSYNTNGASGFVVCHIPIGSFQPHRSEETGKFHIRVGDQCREPSVTWLRRMFVPQFAPDFRLKIHTENGNDQIEGPFQRFTLILDNVGNGTGQKVLLAIYSTPALLWERSLMHWDQRPFSGAGQAYGAQREIHPGETYSGLALRRAPDSSKVEIHVKLFCLNQPALGGSFFYCPSKQLPTTVEIPLEIPRTLLPQVI